MTAITVEQRIINENQRPVQDLLAQYAKDGLTSKQVAEHLNCGVSNVRRIARKYDIRFNQPAPQKTITHSDAFLDRLINSTNLLSRHWHVSKEVAIEEMA
jgi:hypothetical protein